MTDTPIVPEPTQEWPTLTIDAGDYLHFLDDQHDWTEQQKREFIEALWQIIVGVIDLQYPLLGVAKARRFLKTLDDESPSVVALDTNSDIEETQDGKARA